MRWLAVANRPDIFQMLLVRLYVSTLYWCSKTARLSAESQSQTVTSPAPSSSCTASQTLPPPSYSAAAANMPAAAAARFCVVDDNVDVHPAYSRRFSREKLVPSGRSDDDNSKNSKKAKVDKQQQQ